MGAHASHATAVSRNPNLHHGALPIPATPIVFCVSRQAAVTVVALPR